MISRRPFYLPILTLFLFLQSVCQSQTWSQWNHGQSIGSLYGVAVSPTATVAVGLNQTVASGALGRISTRNHQTGEWTIRTYSDAYAFRDVVYGNGQFVAVRDAGKIMTSPDGLTWTSRLSSATHSLRAIVWDGSQYVIAGEVGMILTSPNGVTWTWRNSGSSIYFTGLSFSGSRYVAVGQNGIRISDDAVTWTSPTTAPASVWFEACTWTGTCFIAAGRGSGSTPTIYSSDDGSSWTLRNSTIKDNIASVVTVNGATYIAGAKYGPGYGFVKKSTDNGATWMDIYQPANGSEYFTDLAFDGESLVVAGFNDNVWATGFSTIPATVPPDLDIRLPAIGEVELRMKTKEGMRYQMQSSTNLISWADLGSTVSGDGLTKTVSDTVGTAPRRFYQVVSSPVILAEGELEILEARYGALGVTNDVKSHVEANIQNGTVTITGFNASLGGDPLVGYIKSLYVRYQNHSGIYEAVLPEGSTLTIPDVTHTKIL